MRIRTIKPGFWSNEILAQVSPLGRLLYIGLWQLADREGRLEDRPTRIQHEVLGYEKNCNIEALLGELLKGGFIWRCQVEGVAMIYIPSFLSHQRPNAHEPKSLLASHDVAHACTCMHELGNHAMFPSLPPSPDLSSPDLKRGEHERGDAKIPVNGTPNGLKKITPEELLEGWNLICAESGLPRVEELSGSRRTRVMDRLREHPYEGWWETALNNIANSLFCRGLRPPRTPGGKPFKADFDWLIGNDVNALKAFEGKYNEAKGR